jgi:hypothetical protein
MLSTSYHDRDALKPQMREDPDIAVQQGALVMSRIQLDIK